MKYYHLHIDQDIYCGCYEDIYLKAENEEEVDEWALDSAYDILCDYCDPDDEEPWSKTIWWDIEEITKEEYEGNQ
jgi:hypothetical protein